MKVMPVEGRQGNAIVRFQDWVITKEGPQSVIGIFSHSSEVPEIGKEVEVMISGVRGEVLHRLHLLEEQQQKLNQSATI